MYLVVLLMDLVIVKMSLLHLLELEIKVILEHRVQQVLKVQLVPLVLRVPQVVMDLMDRFEAEFGSTTCRGLLGIDLREPGEHDRFIESGVWQTNCMAQIEFAVAHLAELDLETGGPSEGPS